MKKLLKLSVLALSLVCIIVFGGWTKGNEVPERYADAPIVATIANETIEFSSRTVEYLRTPGGCPFYQQLNGMSNGCGAVAGAEIVAFYDKYHENLVPGWTSYYSTGTYRMQDKVYVPAMMTELYNLMQTNVHDVGVSEQEFLDGLSAYINNHGYSVNYSNVVSGSSINFQACMDAIRSNKVIALLAHAGDVYFVGEYDNYDYVTTQNISGAHIMVGFGYFIYRYYDASGNLFRTDYYLEAAMGQSVLTTALYKVNPHNLSAAYIVNIS